MPRDFLSDDSESPKMETLPGRDFLSESDSPQQENIRTSAALAIPRIGEDIIKSGYGAIQKIPGMYEASKSEVPGLFKSSFSHPLHMAAQRAAGLAELGRNIFNTPHDIINYLSNRLNLIPKSFNDKVQMARMPEDTQQMINQTFGEPKYPGEELARGISRNSLNLLGAGGIAKTLNPMKLTAKNIAEDVINTGKNNKKIYSEHYKNLWKEANNQGMGNALSNVQIDIPTLKKYSPTKGISGILEFDKNPTLETAHAAKSDLLRIQRDLTKLPTLRTAERKQLKATTDAIDNIQENMFKTPSGNINNSLLDKYNKIQRGYAEEVVPYKNKMINKYLRKEITSQQLVNALSKGEFAVKRGKFHPAIGIKNSLPDILKTIGIGGAGIGLGYGGKALYDTVLGNPVAGNQ